MPSGRLAGSRAEAARSSRSMPRSLSPTAWPTVNRPSAKHYRVRVGLQQVGGQGAPLGDDHLRRLVQRRAAHMHRTGAAMPIAAFHLARIGLDIAESVDRQAEQVGGDLLVAGSWPWPFDCVPSTRATCPPGSKRISARSPGVPREVSRKQAIPRPSNRPRAAACWRRSAKPRTVSWPAISSRLAAKRPQSISLPRLR